MKLSSVLLLTLATMGAIFAVRTAILRRFGPKSAVREKEFEWHYINNLFPESALPHLLSLIENKARFRTAVEDATSKVEHIGEAAPAGSPDCAHPLMAPSGKDRSMCVMPSRVDIARHHLMFGGKLGAKETYDTMVPRLLPFIGYVFDQLDTPAMQLMFSSPSYVEQATSVCGGNSVFDPFQLNLILVLPGQDLPMHWDVPWFWGASRFSIPQWLLVAMEQSGLFADRSVPQIQGVAWLHNDTAVSDSASANGGEFFFFPQGPAGRMVTVRSQFNSALVLDGCRVVHGVDRFKPGADLPRLNKTDVNELRFAGGGVWQLFSNDHHVRDYRIEDLRISLVWRARCFPSEQRRREWHEQTSSLELEDVLSTLEADLRKRGRLVEGQARPKPLDFAVMILDEYVRYPIANKEQMMPLNYCMLPRILPPALAGPAQQLLSFFC